MDFNHFGIQLLIAIACATLGNMLIPRQIPGKFFGLIAIGFIGVWLGDLGYKLLKSQFKLDHSLLHLNIERVPIIPSIIGSAIVIYLVTSFVRWNYDR